MPAEVLVMCGQCGRPQPAGQTCVVCGAALPDAVTPQPGGDGSARPAFAAELGRGRVLMLSPIGLEWRRAGEPPRVRALSGIESVSFHARPFYEALLLLVPGLLGLVLGGVARFWMWGPSVVLAVVACLAMRRFSLVLRSKDGGMAELVLGPARPGGASALRYLDAWALLAPELRRRGVKAEDRAP